MNNIPVTIVTKDATLDDMSINDYHDLFYEVRYDSLTDKLMSLDTFRNHIGSRFSKALWGQFHHREITPNRDMRNELRAARGMALLPPTVAEATSQSSPNSMVMRIGEGIPDRIVMIAQSKPFRLRVDESSVDIIEPVTSVARKRKPVVRPVATIEHEKRRLKMRVAWTDVIEAGLLYLESQP